MADVGALPDLSWVEGFTTTHLTAAVDRYRTTADLWSRTFTELAGEMLRPGGAEWVGRGAVAAQDNADGAATVARGAGNTLHDAADVAALGADQLAGLLRKTLAAIADARADGFP